MAFYAVAGAGIAVGVSSQFFAVRAPAGKSIEIHEIRLFARAVTLTPVGLSRTSPKSTAGTALTVAKFDAADAAATFTAVTVATAGTLTAGDLLTFSTGAIGAGIIWVPPSSLVIPANGELVLRNLTATAGSAVDVGMIVEEV